MRDVLTTALDALALLLIAAGVAAFVSQWIGWAALAVAGVVVLAGSMLASRPPKQGAGDES